MRNKRIHHQSVENDNNNVIKINYVQCNKFTYNIKIPCKYMIITHRRHNLPTLQENMFCNFNLMLSQLAVFHCFI